MGGGNGTVRIGGYMDYSIHLLQLHVLFMMDGQMHVLFSFLLAYVLHRRQMKEIGNYYYSYLFFVKNPLFFKENRPWGGQKQGGHPSLLQEEVLVYAVFLLKICIQAVYMCMHAWTDG